MPETNSKRCIYCCKETPIGDFSDEHIIPRFMGGSLDCEQIISRDVCKNCNILYGRFVDAAVAKSYFLKTIETGTWRGCYDFDLTKGNIHPLIYFGTSTEIDFADNEVVEVWLCPDGGTAWNIHNDYGDDFDTLAGGDPVLRRRDSSGRAYVFMASQNMYWGLSNLKSAVDHFYEEPVYLGTDISIDGKIDFEASLPKERIRGRLCQKDDIQKGERDKIRNLLERGGQLGHSVPMDTLFDVRFLAKIAIAFGFKLLGEEFGNLAYTSMLRGILWTRRKNLDATFPSVRMKTYFAGLQDLSLKFMAFPLGYVFMTKLIQKDLVLAIVYPSGHSVQVSITDSTIDQDVDLRARQKNDQLFVSIPQLHKTIGPFAFEEYLAWLSGAAKIDALDQVKARLTLREVLPPRK